MILELSTKCAPSEAFQRVAELKAFLTQRDIDLSGDQETKTKKALEFFSKELQTEAAEDPLQNDQPNDSVASNRVSQ